ncbi:hypothetical protein HK096_007379, partial [Nowakowskiella sp. JEL0078]
MLLKSYLILYNLASLLAWAYGLSLLLSELYISKDVLVAYNKSGDVIRWAQTAALLEVAHSLLGFVRSPVSTTITQVSSRLLLMWGVLYPFEDPSVRGSPAYATMVTAWGITELIRYSFYALNLIGPVPSILSWCRYNFFFILYPVGALSESFLVWKAIPFTPAVHQYLPYVFWALLPIYPPGLVIMMGHMIKQRRSYYKKAYSEAPKTGKK